MFQAKRRPREGGGSVTARRCEPSACLVGCGTTRPSSLLTQSRTNLVQPALGETHRQADWSSFRLCLRGHGETVACSQTTKHRIRFGFLPARTQARSADPAPATLQPVHAATVCQIPRPRWISTAPEGVVGALPLSLLLGVSSNCAVGMEVLGEGGRRLAV